MNLANSAGWLKRNWVICVLLAAIGVAISWNPNRAESPEATAEPPPKNLEAEQEALKKTFDAMLYEQHVQIRERAAAKSAIAEHLEALENDLEPEEYAIHLCALGNLYQQKTGDFETAASYYELLLEEYPEWTGSRAAYHQLIACYKYLNDQSSLRVLYRRMVEAFPEGSPEHEYAKAELVF